MEFNPSALPFPDDAEGLYLFLFSSNYDALVERGDPTAIRQLVELILGCAVHCAKKEEYITVIVTKLEEGVKVDLMTIIQHLMSQVSSLPAVPPTPGMLFVRIKIKTWTMVLEEHT